MPQLLKTLFVDFDAWFASLEQALNPSLQGKPVAVVPVMTERTCCIATSYEAKRLGIKTGTSVWDAKTICPELQLVTSNTARYVHYHERMVAAINRCIPIDEVVSIDEVTCSLTGSWQQPEVAIGVARKIKQAVTKVLPVTCSIGIAPNQFLAKMASKLNKPDGLRVLKASDVPTAFSQLTLEDLTGVGKNMHTRLRQVGIDSIYKLYAAKRATLRSVWGGIEGERMYEELRGQAPYRPPTQRRSVGHSHVLRPEFRRPDKALAVMHKMLQKAAFRMREMNCHASGMSMSMRLSGENGSERFSWGEHAKFAPINDTRELVVVLKALWKRRPLRKKIITVGVQLYDLIPDGDVSGALFTRRTQHRDMAQGNLSMVADNINKRFGAQSVYFGGAKEGLEGAPMRIAFTQIPNVKLENDGAAANHLYKDS